MQMKSHFLTIPIVSDTLKHNLLVKSVTSVTLRLIAKCSIIVALLVNVAWL